MSINYKAKPSLKMQINTNDDRQCQEVKYIKPIVKSVKNNHQMKKFNFSQVVTIFPTQKMQKQDKINKLQLEKAQLMESLEILKNGALNAIVEKQEVITKLRKLFIQTHSKQSQDDVKLQQLQKLLQIIKDLQEQRNILKFQVEKQRETFYREIQQREEIIQQLTNQLNWSTQRIESLQRYDKLLEQKIKVMQESNQNLFYMLNQSHQTLLDQRRKHCSSGLLLKNKSDQSINKGQDFVNQLNQNVKPPRKISQIYHTQQLCLSTCRSFEQPFIQSKIQQIKNQHQIQIQDLTDFYQARIQSLKKLCQHYTDVSLVHGKSKDLNETNNVTEIFDTNSYLSGYTNDVKQHEKSLIKQTSLGSFKQGGRFKMDTIDQKQEIQNPRRSLRKQISSFYKYNSNSSKKSEQNGQNQSKASLSSNQQKQSQFSQKYFSYPLSGLKKNKSQNSTPYKLPQFQISKSRESQTKGTQSTQKQLKIQRKINETTQFWKKLSLFVSGTLTGVILVKFRNRLFR